MAVVSSRRSCESPKSAQISRIIELPKKTCKPSRWVTACLPRARPPMPPAPAASRLQRQRIHAGGNIPLETCAHKDISLCLRQKKGNIRLKISDSAFYSDNFSLPPPFVLFRKEISLKLLQKDFLCHGGQKKKLSSEFSLLKQRGFERQRRKEIETTRRKECRNIWPLVGFLPHFYRRETFSSQDFSGSEKREKWGKGIGKGLSFFPFLAKETFSCFFALPPFPNRVRLYR